MHPNYVHYKLAIRCTKCICVQVLITALDWLSIDMPLTSWLILGQQLNHLFAVVGRVLTHSHVLTDLMACILSTEFWRRCWYRCPWHVSMTCQLRVDQGYWLTLTTLDAFCMHDTRLVQYTYIKSLHVFMKFILPVLGELCKYSVVCHIRSKLKSKKSFVLTISCHKLSKAYLIKSALYIDGYITTFKYIHGLVDHNF